MKAQGFWQLEDVSDTEIVGGLKELVVRSAWTEARLVAYLAELDARKLHLLAGRSLFAYCQQQLGLSGNEAHYRIQAARLARKYPVIFELLDQRRIHLSALALIRYYITPENHRELLQAVSGKTKEQILKLLVTRAPRPEVANRIRTLPVPTSAVAAGPSGTLAPQSATSYRLELNIGESLKQKLELACDLMSHSNPARDWTVAIERGLDALLDKLQKQRFAQTSRGRARKPPPGVAQGGGEAPSRDSASKGKPLEHDRALAPGVHDEHAEPTARMAVPSPPTGVESQVELPPARTDDTGRAVAPNSGAPGSSSPPPRTRPNGSAGSRASSRQRSRIPSEVLRELVERDGIGCTYTSEEGERCGQRAFLQVHHRQPWATGGADTLDNLQLVCADHNRLLAERDFGTTQVQAAIERKRVA